MVLTENFYMALGLGFVALVIVGILVYLLTRVQDNKFDKEKRGMRAKGKERMLGGGARRRVVVGGSAPKMQVKRAPILRKRKQ